MVSSILYVRCDASTLLALTRCFNRREDAGEHLRRPRDRFSPATHIKIVGKTFLIAIFLLDYKTSLMTFDYLIESLCFFQYEVIQRANSGVVYENAFVKWFVH